jgi:hypothetical protein
MTFTFVTEKAGSTVIEQFSGRDVREATRNWYRESQTRPGRPLLDDDGANPVAGARNVWCRSGIDPKGCSTWCTLWRLLWCMGCEGVPRTGTDG